MTEKVGIGHYRVLRGNGLLVAYGLGSCVGLFLYDEETAVGGVAHIMLPGERPENLPVSPHKYAANASRSLLEEMRIAGADIRRIGAILIGGAHMFRDPDVDLKQTIGQKNVESVRAILRNNRIPIRTEETGGDAGRTMEADVSNGNVLVRSIRFGAKELKWKK